MRKIPKGNTSALILGMPSDGDEIVQPLNTEAVKAFLVQQTA